MNRAYLGLGSNMGDRFNYLLSGLEFLKNIGGIQISKISSLYRTIPMGYTAQRDFYNLVAEVETALTPRELLAAAQAAEDAAGRKRLIHWGPRTLDVDILLYDGCIMDEPELVLPHPRLMERPFVLIPLVEIAPGIVVGGRAISEIVKALPDNGVKLLPESSRRLHVWARRQINR